MKMSQVVESDVRSMNEKKLEGLMGKVIIDPNSEILKSFKQYSAELDKKHDRHERIVKLSRDLTTESKRIIFLLHAIGRGREVKEVVIEAEKRLNNLVNGCLHNIAKELENEDPYMFLKAYTYGLQEFIEAYTYYHYLRDKTLNHWNHYQDLLKYTLKNSNGDTNGISATLPPLDYFLGVADLTGELMRKCVNSAGSGDLQGCFETCKIVKQIYAGFLSIPTCKSFHLFEKIRVVKQNLLKMEKVCYNINIRGKELPGNVLVHFVNDFEQEKDFS